MRVHRVFKRRLLASALTGEGARRFGGRWNHEGYAVVYVAAHLSLAALELLVHAQGQSALADLLCYEVDIPEPLISTLTQGDLPTDWRLADAPAVLRDIGTHWLVTKPSLALKVPSAIVPKEYNLLLNPKHQDFSQLHWSDPEPFDFDPRLIKRFSPSAS